MQVRCLLISVLLLFSPPFALGQAQQATAKCSAVGSGSVSDTPTLDPIAPGSQYVFGKFANSKSGTVRICVNDQEVVQAPIGADGTFTANLHKSVYANDKVIAQTVSQMGATVSYGLPSAPASPTGEEGHYALGPTRAYFSAGAILSQDNNQLQGSAVFLGLTTDSMWYKHIPHESDNAQHAKKSREKHAVPADNKLSNNAPTTEISQRHGSAAETGDKGNHDLWHILCVACSQINTYFDARLTSAPVTSCTPNTSTTINTSNCAAGSNTLFDTFNASKKAALVSGGIYLPYYFKYFPDTNVPDHGYRLFLAPLVKGGLQTLVESAQAQSGVPGTTPTATTTVNGQTFFHFYATGLRLGLFRMHNEPGLDIPPDTLMYFDLTVGKYENFPTVDPKTGNVTDHPWRLGLEGRFRIPGVPLLMLGFDSNTRPGTSQGSSGDLRFLFGTTFDVGCMMQKVIGNPATQIPGCESSKNQAASASRQ